MQPQHPLFNETGTAIHLHEFTHRVKAGDVVVVGELHGFHPHHQNQITIIRELQALGFNVAVGVEHLAYPQQNFLDQYTSGKIDEPTFMAEKLVYKLF